MRNKRGQDLSIGTLILIVLGIIVLVLLILGFSLGWENLWAKINIFGGGATLADAATSCSLAVTQNNKFSYCNEFKEVKVDGKKEYVNCEDDRLSLQKEMACDSSSQERIDKQCINIIKAGNNKETVKVNGQSCWNKYDCLTDLKGKLASANENCPSDQTKKLDKKSGIKELGERFCCISP